MSDSLRRPVQFCAVSLFLWMAAWGCTSGQTEREAQPASLENDVQWLSQPDLKGRLAGSEGEAKAANYISDRFLESGLAPAGEDGTFLQLFTLSGPMAQAMDAEGTLARNVAGALRPLQEDDEVIIVGAHYDSQGMGGIISMDHESGEQLHPGADDNASGTAVLMELARQFSAKPIDKNILFVAFSGEELGLLGSRHFVRNMDLRSDRIVAMINLDMVGRMEGNELTIFGTESAELWSTILDQAPDDTLRIERVPSGSGASDHTSFFEAGIPVLHYFTGIHPQYHRPEDTVDLLNVAGMHAIARHVSGVIRELDTVSASDMEFAGTARRQSPPMDFDGPTLGVLPDYSFGGDGFRIDGVQPGSAADRAGLLAGDVIVRIGGNRVGDIYGYMEALNRFSAGDQTVIRIRRNGTEESVDVQF
ncbi:MAG: M20/M25/M40 family metallo-hydrolase [Balneolaceae bacterium]